MQHIPNDSNVLDALDALEGGNGMTNYCITWGYIVRKMEERFGIKPTSTEEFSMGEIKRYMESIWNEFFQERDKQIFDNEVKE